MLFKDSKVKCAPNRLGGDSTCCYLGGEGGLPWTQAFLFSVLNTLKDGGLNTKGRLAELLK